MFYMDTLTYVLLFWCFLLTGVVFYGLFFLKTLFPHKKRGLYKTIEESLNKADRLEKQALETLEQIKALEKKNGLNFQKCGLVRFNPFERVGGEQSYVFSLLNKENSGMVITFLYMREGVRVYVKQVVRGRGKGVDLSKEEEKAVVKAE